MVYTRFPDHTVWSARPDGTSRVELTDTQVEAHQPHWSPDRTRVAFMGKNAKGQWRVMLVPAKGGQPEEPLPSDEDQGVPTWGPDGHEIIFGDRLGTRPRAEMSVHMLDLNTHKVSDLPGSKGQWSPRWSPDGKYISAITSDLHVLNVMPIGKAGWKELVHMIYVDNATWSADSRYIYFDGSIEAGERGLFRISVPRGRLEQIADLTKFEVAAENWYGVRPDGTPLAFHGITVQEIFALKCELLLIENAWRYLQHACASRVHSYARTLMPNLLPPVSATADTRAAVSVSAVSKHPLHYLVMCAGWSDPALVLTVSFMEVNNRLIVLNPSFSFQLPTASELLPNP